MTTLAKLIGLLCFLAWLSPAIGAGAAADSTGRETTSSLDDDCARVDSLTIRLDSTGQHVDLNWKACQPGTYTIIGVNDLAYPGGAHIEDWTVLGNTTVTDPSPQSWTDLRPLITRQSYFIIHSCFPPENDECEGALWLTGSQTTFDTRLATSNGPGEWFNGEIGPVFNDVWFKYHVTGCEQVDLNACGSNFDTRLAVYAMTDGCPSHDTTAVASNDNRCSLQSRLSWIALCDSTYLIRVGGVPGASGAGVLNHVSFALTGEPPRVPIQVEPRDQ